MKASKLKSAVFLYLIGMVMIHAAVFWNAREFIRKGYSDFTIYYGAGTILRRGLGHQLYDDRTQYRVQREFAPEVDIRLDALPYNHPPFEAALFVPFTYLAYSSAFALWGSVNLAMLVALPFLLRPHLRYLQDYRWPLWLLASLGFFPIFVALLQGQDSILLLFLYTLAFVCLKNNRDSYAGGCLALGLFKPHLVLPFVILLLVQGRKRIMYGFLPMAGLVALASIPIVGGGELLRYPSYVLHLEDTTAGGAISPTGMPNLRGLLDTLSGPRPHSHVLVFMLSIGIVLLTAKQLRSNSGFGLFDFQFSLAAFVTVFVSYHALAYDLSILMLPTVLVANELLGQGMLAEWPDWLTTLGAVVLFFSPLPLLLLMRYRYLALMALAVLLCMLGIAGQISFRTRHSHSLAT